MCGGENYFKHRMSDYEKEIATKLVSKLKFALSSDSGLEGLDIKYSTKIGYYVIEDNDRGHYSMYFGFPTTDENEAFLILLACGSKYQGYCYEFKNRTQYEKEWKNSYKSKYDGRKIAFEYSLRKLDEVLGYVPSNYIEMYEGYLNISGQTWRFDNTLKCFVEVV